MAPAYRNYGIPDADIQSLIDRVLPEEGKENGMRLFFRDGRHRWIVSEDEFDARQEA